MITNNSGGLRPATIQSYDLYFLVIIMAARIAETSFSTGPDNKAVTVDVYKEPPLTPTNNQPAGSTNNSILGTLTNTDNQKLGFLSSIAKQYAQTGKITPDKNLIIKNIGNVFGVTNGTVGTIGGKVMDNLLRANGFYGTGIGATVDRLSKTITGNSFSDSMKKGFTDVSLVVNNVKKDIKALEDLDFNNLTELSQAISKISGDNDFVRLLNLTEAAGVVKALNDMATQMYIPGVADRLMKDLSDDDRKTVTGLFNASLTSVTDLSTLDTLIANLTPEEITNTNPTIIKLAVGGFTGGTDFYQPSKEAADALLDRLVKIDAKWDSLRVAEGRYQSDLDVFRNFSGFAKDSFICAGYYLPELAIASSYSSKPFTTVAKELYPLIGFSA